MDHLREAENGPLGGFHRSLATMLAATSLLSIRSQRYPCPADRALAERLLRRSRCAAIPLIRIDKCQPRQKSPALPTQHCRS
jgi:hypothetical protein